MHQDMQELLRRLREHNDLESATAILSWDQATYMPAGGAESSGRQLATLERLAHEKLTDPGLARLLDRLSLHERALAPDSFDASLVRVARRDHERASRLPADFVTEKATHLATTYDAWTRARPANDFAGGAPLLEKTLELSRHYASYFPGPRTSPTP